MHKKLQEQLDAAKANLTAAMEGTDPEAIKNATAEVKAAKDALSAADEADALIKSLGTNTAKKSENEPAVRTLGDFAMKHLNIEGLRNGSVQTTGSDFGFKTYTDAQTSQQIIQYSADVVDTAYRDLAVRSLFGAERITGNAIKYFILGAREDNSAPAPGTVSEGGAKPQFHIVESSATATLQKIAGWLYETDELLEDNAFLKTAIDNRALFELDLAVESWLLTTLAGTSGLGTATYTHGGTVGADDIYKCFTKIKKDSGLNADAIIIHPDDYETIRLAKDQVYQYYGGGYFYGPYGNSSAVAQQPGIWGLNTIVTPSATKGTVLVGNFRIGATIYSKDNAGARIQIHVGDHDDAIYNRVTVVVEERLALAVRRPKAFVKLTEAAS